MSSVPPLPPPYGSVPGEIWPPPPMTAQPQAVYAAPVCPFKWLYRRAPGKAGAKANVADFREGYLQFDPEGIIIQAKAVPRAEIRAWVLVPCVLLSLLIAVVANSIMEYAMRSDQRLGVRWDSIKEILLSPDKQQACLVYDAPNYKGNIKTFTLAFTPAPGYYEMLVQAARQYAPGQIAEGRLKSATPLLVLIFLILILVTVFGAILYAALAPQH